MYDWCIELFFLDNLVLIPKYILEYFIIYRSNKYFSKLNLIAQYSQYRIEQSFLSITKKFFFLF